MKESRQKKRMGYNGTEDGRRYARQIERMTGKILNKGNHVIS